jgi:hypothetical protein
MHSRERAYFEDIDQQNPHPFEWRRDNREGEPVPEPDIIGQIVAAQRSVINALRLYWTGDIYCLN